MHLKATAVAVATIKNDTEPTSKMNQRNVPKTIGVGQELIGNGKIGIGSSRRRSSHNKYIPSLA
jgi:hypothetical protein